MATMVAKPIASGVLRSPRIRRWIDAKTFEPAHVESWEMKWMESGDDVVHRSPPLCFGVGSVRHDQLDGCGEHLYRQV